MEFIARQIVRMRRQIIALFAVALVVFGVCALTVGINYNMTDYLPAEANSTKAITAMEESFGEELANATVMAPVQGVTEAQELKEKIKEVPGVSEVLWLDDVLDVKTPLEAQDQDTVETYYKDGRALYTVTIRSGHETEASQALYELVGEQGALSGNAIEQANSQNMALSEALHAVMVLGPLIILILLLATRSWAEPLIFLLCIGASVVINLGFSGLSGEICYVTLSVAPILQLAVALDYAVFLSNAYTAEREKTEDSEQAMCRAIAGSSKAIFASALVGVFAFAALSFMDFQIGPDMGWALVRGVVISYLAVMLLLPALMVSCDKLIRATRHRSFFPSFGKLSGGLVKARIPLLLIVIVLAVPSFLAQGSNSFIYGSGEATPGTRLADDQAKIEATFESDNTLALLVPRGNPAAEAELCAQIEGMAGVKSVTSYSTAVSNAIPAEFLGSAAESFYSDEYARIIVYVSTPSEGDEAFALVEQVRAAADELYGPDEALMCGQSANLYDMMETVQADNERVDLTTIVCILVVLAFIFRSLIIPVIAVVTIKCAVFINMAIPYFAGDELSFIGYMVVSVVMMGSAIDYGILLIDHYLVQRRTHSALPAMRAALTQAIPAMLVSALILAVAGFALSAVSSEGMVQALGLLLGRGAVIAFVLSVTLLPALLTLFDRLLPKLSVGLSFSSEKGGASGERGASGEHEVDGAGEADGASEAGGAGGKREAGGAGGAGGVLGAGEAGDERARIGAGAHGDA